MTENSNKPRIVVLNTRAANVHSVEKALRKVGADPIVTSDPTELESADAAVLPGVGASDAVMKALNTLGMADPVKEFAASGKPLLCVCVGLQVLFDSSEEGELPGLGLIDGNVELSRAELAESQAAQRSADPESLFNSADTNGDGALTFNELQQAFRKLRPNHN